MHVPKRASRCETNTSPTLLPFFFFFSSVAKSKYYKLNPSKVQKPLTLSLSLSLALALSLFIKKKKKKNCFCQLGFDKIVVDSSFGHRIQRLWFCVLWFEEEEERRRERCLVHQNEKRPHQVQLLSNLLTPFLFVPVLNPNPPKIFLSVCFPRKKKKNAGKENHIKISALTNLLIIKKKKKKLNSRWFL